ncbi:MAG: hypothetical protein JSU07_03580 [Bacteroidetes bacterium]|nr:hypothetical protein [Bacteroidota bacterium]
MKLMKDMLEACKIAEELHKLPLPDKGSNWTQKTELTPTDECVITYVCKKYGAEMHPKNGDCCVFCTYEAHKCPSKQ